MITRANIHKRNEIESTINIIDIIMEDIKQNKTNKEEIINFSLTFLWDFNYITFKNFQNINKAFNKKDFDLMTIYLKDLRNKSIKKLHQLYFN